MAKRTTGRKTAAGKASRKRQAAKKATKKAAKKIARKSAKKAAKKATKKSARKSAKKSAKKSAQRPGKAKTAAQKPARKAAKKAAKKGAKKSPRKAAAKKQSAVRQPVFTAATPRAAKAAAGATMPAKSSASPTVLPARKPLATSITRKTARSRLAQRLKPEAKPPARKIALRTSVGHSSAHERPGRRPPAQYERPGFDPSALGFRTASRQDWPAIANLLTEAFGGPKEKDIVERLRESGDMVVEYVAEYAGEIVAHIGFCALGTDAGDPALKFAALVPLAVAGEVEGHGIGTRLVALGLEALRGEGFSGVLVLGDPDFYSQCGFSTEVALRFDSRFAGPQLQALIFEPESLGEACVKLVWPEILTRR